MLSAVESGRALGDDGVHGRGLDEATPATVQPFFDNIADVRWEIFEHSSHMPFVEETEHYLEMVNVFPTEVDEA